MDDDDEEKQQRKIMRFNYKTLVVVYCTRDYLYLK